MLTSERLVGLNMSEGVEIGRWWSLRGGQGLWVQVWSWRIEGQLCEGHEEMEGSKCHGHDRPMRLEWMGFEAGPGVYRGGIQGEATPLGSLASLASTGSLVETEEVGICRIPSTVSAYRPRGMRGRITSGKERGSHPRRRERQY